MRNININDKALTVPTQPLRVVGEVLEWEGYSPKVLQNLLDNFEKLKRLGIEAINN